GVRLSLEAGDDQVEAPVAVVVARIDAHRGLGVSQRVVSDARLQSHIVEAGRRVGGRVVVEGAIGDPTVGGGGGGTPVIIVVEEETPQALAVRSDDAGGAGDVAERPVPLVVEEAARIAVVVIGGAGQLDAADRTERLAPGAEAEVAADVEVKPAVP